MSDIVLYRGIEMVTSVTAAVGFVILLYLLIKAGERPDQRQVFLGLAIILSLTVILVHQVSFFMILGLVAILILSEIIINCKKYFQNYYFLLLTITLALTYWMYDASVFLYGVIMNRWSNINLEAGHSELVTL